MQSLFKSLADLFRGLGDPIRNAAHSIPMFAVKLLFIAVLVVILVWVLKRSPEEATGEVHGASKNIDLRPFAAFALIVQIILYSVL